MRIYTITFADPNSGEPRTVAGESEDEARDRMEEQYEDVHEDDWHLSLHIVGVTPLSEVIKTIDPLAAQRVVVQAMAAMGSEKEWDSSMIESVAEPMIALAQRSGLPPFTDQDDAAVIFWRSVQ